MLSGVLCQLPTDLTNRVSEENRFRLNNFLGRQRDRKPGRNNLVPPSTVSGTDLGPSSPTFDVINDVTTNPTEVPTQWTTEPSRQKPPRPPQVQFLENNLLGPTNELSPGLGPVPNPATDITAPSEGFVPNKPPPPPKLPFQDAMLPTITNELVPQDSQQPIVAGPEIMITASSVTTGPPAAPLLPDNNFVSPESSPVPGSNTDPNTRLTAEDIRKVAERLKSRREMIGSPKPSTNQILPPNRQPASLLPRQPAVSNNVGRLVPLSRNFPASQDLPQELFPASRFGPVSILRSVFSPLQRLIRAMIYRHLIVCGQTPNCRILAVRRRGNRSPEVLSFNSLEDLQNSGSRIRPRRRFPPVYRIRFQK